MFLPDCIELYKILFYLIVGNILSMHFVIKINKPHNPFYFFCNYEAFHSRILSTITFLRPLLIEDHVLKLKHVESLGK